MKTGAGVIYCCQNTPRGPHPRRNGGIPMEFRYEAERIYLTDDHGRMAAEITFHQRSDRAMSIDHTYVSP